MSRSTSETVSLRPPSLKAPNATPPRPLRSDQLVGLNLGGYVVTRAICSGGMGVVYEARNPDTGARGAVKVIRPEYQEDESLAGRFHGEISSISSIRHPNVVEILGVGVLPNGGEYMLMEYVEGETLGDLIARSAPLPLRLALQITEDILQGLTAMHEMGIVHRDLKPGNILLCRDPRRYDVLTVKICDFGLARLTEARRPSDGPRPSIPPEGVNTVAGTPEYISPEQASGQAVDGQADLYSLGVMLFEMLTGRLPFRAPTGVALMRMHCQNRAPRVNATVAAVPWEIDAFVDHLLAKDPSDRPLGALSTVEKVRGLREALPGYGRYVQGAVPTLREEGFTSAMHGALTQPPTAPGPG
jgi:eukaryotic-like serine/threonine-protein kinase